MSPEEPQLAVHGVWTCWQEAPEGAAFCMVQEPAQAFQRDKFSFQNKLLVYLVETYSPRFK